MCTNKLKDTITKNKHKTKARFACLYDVQPGAYFYSHGAHTGQTCLVVQLIKVVQWCSGTVK